MTTLWYGATAAWWAPLERDARRADGDRLRIELDHRRLTYRHTGVEVPGRRDLVPVRIEFFADPPYNCYGLPPEDYPRVFADPDQLSPHRMPDDSLCLFYPADPRTGGGGPRTGCCRCSGSYAITCSSSCTGGPPAPTTAERGSVSRPRTAFRR